MGVPTSGSDVDFLLVVERLDAKPAEYLRRAYRAVRDLDVPVEFVVKRWRKWPNFNRLNPR